MEIAFLDEIIDDFKKERSRNENNRMRAFQV